MGDLYVTDHEPRQSKVFTLNQEEDEKLFKYYQSLEEYNETPTKLHQEEKERRFKRGTMMQFMFDPFAGAKRLDNGALFYEVKDEELPALLKDEDKLREEYDKIKQ